MSERNDLFLIEDMIDAAKKIRKYCSGYNYEQFLEDERTIDAVIRNFEIIGEAANRLHPDVQAANKGIEWNKIRGFRNRLIHEYFGVDHKIVWQIIESELDDLILELEHII